MKKQLRHVNVTSSRKIFGKGFLNWEKQKSTSACAFSITEALYIASVVQLNNITLHLQLRALSDFQRVKTIGNCWMCNYLKQFQIWVPIKFQVVIKLCFSVDLLTIILQKFISITLKAKEDSMLREMTWSYRMQTSSKLTVVSWQYQTKISWFSQVIVTCTSLISVRVLSQLWKRSNESEFNNLLLR